MQNSRSHWSHREPRKISKWLLRMMIVLHALCLMSLLTGCGSINTRLEQSARIIQRTPDEVLPALVLAATWFDNAARDADIIRRNAITHPGFVPVIPLKVPVQ